MAVGEVVADGDALADGDVFLVGVGFGDFAGTGLVSELDGVVGCSATTLGVSVGVGSACWLAGREDVTLGEFGCCVLVLPAVPLALPLAWPLRYKPIAAASAHRPTVAPAATPRQ